MVVMMMERKNGNKIMALVEKGRKRVDDVDGEEDGDNEE